MGNTIPPRINAAVSPVILARVTFPAVSVAGVCADPVVRDQWHALAAVDEIGADVSTRLLGLPIGYGLGADGTARAWRSDDGSPIPARADYGYLWASVGDPPDEVFDVPETREPDRRTLNAGTLGVAVSAPRAVENFLDIAHFPYVHRGVLGDEPHTEVAEYDVVDRDGEIWALGCRFHQPRAAAASTDEADVQYQYRVPHPYCAMLYKSAPGHPDRLDAIGIFTHPLDDERIRAHLFLCVLDDVNADNVIRRFQQTILAQDMPILENQHPKRLPLDPRAETPVRCDKTAIAYRRWLSDLGVTYGVIPAGAG